MNVYSQCTSLVTYRLRVSGEALRMIEVRNEKERERERERENGRERERE